MSQHDLNIANQSFPATRSDINAALVALGSNSSGATEPSTTYAYQWWYDTTTDILKLRNAANDGWISFAEFDQVNDTWSMTANLSFDDNEKLLMGTSNDLEIFHNGTNSVINENGTGELLLQVAGVTKLSTNASGIDVTGTVTFDGGSTSADLSFGDNDKAIFGAGSDLQIYHDGSTSFVEDAGTGNLVVKTNGGGILLLSGAENLAQFVSNGAATLYYDNSARLATTVTGVDFTGTITADGLDMEDNQKILLGASDDLQLYHDGSNSYIYEGGVGSLNLLTSTQLKIGNAANTEVYAKFNENGDVELRYDNAVKFATTSYGVSVTGSAVASTQTYTTTATSVLAAFDLYQNFVWTLDRNITLANPSTEKVGQSGFFVFIHSGAGRTVSLGTDYETAGGAGLTLSTTAGATDIVPYIVAASGRILLGTPQLAFA